MNLPKALLPLLAASACLGGCVYEESYTEYREPRRVHHGGYVEQEVVVEQRPRHYYRERPVVVYEERPRAYYYNDRPRVYGGGVAVIHDHHGETWDERQKRELRERQREHDKKDDDHKKKKKKKDHDDD